MNDNIIQYVIAAGNGDTDAMAKLYAGTLKGSYFLASKLCDSDEEAVDITRKAYAKVFCTIDKLKKPEAFEIWMKQMIASLYKESRKFVFADADGGAHEPDSDFLPEAILENDADAEKVVSAVASLSPERRTAIILHYNNGMPVSVLSKFLGVSESTANAILSKARAEIVEKSGIKAPDYPELSTLPVLTRLFKKLAAEVKIDNATVREMFIFILECVEAAKPAETVEEIKEETPVVAQVKEESSKETDEAEVSEESEVETVKESEETEETTEEEATEEIAEEPEAVEETEETAEADEEIEAAEEAEAAEEVAEEEQEETAEDAVDKIEEEIVSFKDRISTLIGVEEAEEVADEPAESADEIEELDESFDVEEAEKETESEETETEETETQGDDLLEAIKRSMDELNDIADSEEVVDFDEDSGAISFANFKKEDEFKPEEPALPAKEEEKEAAKFEPKKKAAPKLDKKVIIIIAAITVLIVAVIAVVIGVSVKNKDKEETTSPASSYASDIATQWKVVDALNAYDSISYLNEEYAMFEADGKYGLLDNFGNVVLNADYDGFKMCSYGKDYDNSNSYHLLAVKDGKSYEVTYENGIPTVTSDVHANHATDTAATPGSEDYVERDRYYEGYAAAKNADGKWGYVAKDSDMLVIDYLYEAPNEFSYAADSCRGFDKGVVAVMKDGKMGIINTDGVVVDFEYDVILQGEDGVYVAMKDGEWGILLVGDEAIAYYADHQVETEAPDSTTPDAPSGDPVGVYVARDDINVRKGPSSDYDKLGTIDAGTSIEVFEIRDSENSDDSNDFAKIEYNGQVGWVSMGLLEEE